MLQIDQELYMELQKNTIEAKMHSCFHSAWNARRDQELITFLAGGKCLQPMSLRFEQPIDFQECRIPAGRPLYLSLSGLSDGAEEIFHFTGFEAKDLELDLKRPLEPECAGWIRDFLRKQDEKGIHGIIEGNVNDRFTEYLEPRIQRFRAAVKTRDHENILNAVNQTAGCGPGLTPSSDDFLCGYISVMPRTEVYAGIRKVIAGTAAAKTNDISASLLKHAEKGRFSEDILELFLGFKTKDRKETESFIRKVADFGSSSGCDFLTGMYYGILDAQERKVESIDQVGNQKKCLL